MKSSIERQNILKKGRITGYAMILLAAVGSIAVLFLYYKPADPKSLFETSTMLTLLILFGVLGWILVCASKTQK